MTAGIEFDKDGMPFDVDPAKPAEPAAGPVATEQSQDALTSEPAIENAAQEAFSAPKAPHEYQFTPLDGKPPSDADYEIESSIRQSLYDEGFPTFAAHLAHQVIARNVKGGMPDEATLQASIRAGRAELERRHGVGAQEIINEARKVIDRLDKRDPRIVDMLANTGALNDPHLIETLARVQRDYYARRK